MAADSHGYHRPVLLEQTLDALNIRPDGLYLDGTAGGGGHSAEILKHLTTGKLISIDQDPDAITMLTQKFKKNENAIVIKGNFGNMKDLLELRGVRRVDGVLLDIGVSSHQLDTASRGFSFHEDAPLDMRMSQSGVTAEEMVNTLPYEELRRIIAEYGEERYASSIARGIIAAREQAPVTTTLQLAEIVKNNVPQKVRRDGHPARKTFQAIRIAVNDELNVLSRGLDDAFRLLGKGGRLAVITFHSLEDRIVKQKMAGWCQGCTCPKDFPVCVCGNKPKARLITKKPVCANETELADNPRARSAKLRICEKI